MNNPQVLTLSHITFSYPESIEPIIEDVSLTLSPGWTVLLGDNGIGKTTLARLAIGGLQPQSGHVSPAPSTMVSAFCRQDAKLPPDNLDDFAADWSAETLHIRKLLGIGDDWPYRYDTLSGGEAKRVQVACALAVHPDVLVLDEPTNYVDVPTRDAICSALDTFSKIGILVSHDVEFIDRVAARCAYFERIHRNGRNFTQIKLRPGNFSDSQSQLRKDDESEKRRLREATIQVNRLTAVKHDRDHEVAKVEAKKHGGRKIDPKDHDARNTLKMRNMMGRDASSSAASAQIGARIGFARKREQGIAVGAKRYDGRLDLIADIRPSHHDELVGFGPGVIEYGGSGLSEKNLPPDFSLRRVSISGFDTDTSDGTYRSENEGREPVDKTSENSADSRGGNAVLSSNYRGIRVPRLSVGPTDHIGVTGSNGTGKSTLVNALLQVFSQQNLPILVIPQETGVNDQGGVLSRFVSLAQMQRSKVLSDYAQLNSNPKRVLDIVEKFTAHETSPSGKETQIVDTRDALSPGELRKLLLCVGLLDGPQLMVLDEPTNHLDLHSKEALANALLSYAGALIVVSHDMWFLEKVASIRWNIR
ncbi:ATP-binding cassette domain-containing protein [Bifidobacterium sp. ESL0784]|uniref:ATP-binding cassette domain-containing protein n=1 Tax=Bifidobacterium sp. ESL0784 TaxID=2983231 RepID=UPI0023F9886D|nr:ATP-binding cassette domain-containing protein [Bifidobacterium sp. ESL0784]MDF7641019.1 ATP-binding cassette domain-containing protein [Bifidobacterium sp. ESL0784]